MTTVQKIIKYLALALALFIIINIISAVLTGLGIFAGVLGLNKKEKEINVEEIASIVNIEDIKALKIELAYSELEIKEGTQLKIEANSKEIKCTTNNNRLTIQEENRNLFSKKDANRVIVYIPQNTIFDEVDIETGARRNYY